MKHCVLLFIDGNEAKVTVVNMAKPDYGKITRE